MLAELYGSTWEFVHGDSSSEALVRFLNSMNPESTQRLFNHCREQIAGGGKFAPHLGQLSVFADEPTETEFLEILIRVQSNEPANDLEIWLAENVRYNLRTVRACDEIKYLKSQYRKARALEKNGKLQTSKDDLLSLPRHSVKSLSDIHREKFDGELNPRIAKILKSHTRRTSDEKD